MRTTTLKPPAPLWLLVDASGKTLGRLAAEIAHILRGKHRPGFAPHQLCGDHIVVTNAVNVAVTPRKLRQKEYFSHTGYLGHTKIIRLEQMLKDSPEKVLEIAIKGMLPRNRLRNEMLKRLHVFPGAEHNHHAQKPQSLSLS